MLRSFPRLVLPDDVLSLEGERFSVLVQRTCGDVMKELMRKLALRSTRHLLMVDSDILALLQQNYRELEEIKHRACLHLDDGSVMLKPGLRIDFDRFIESLRAVEAKHQQQQSTDNPVDQILSSIETLMKSYSSSETSDLRTGHSFVLGIIRNILDNLMRQKNNYRYSETVQRFAQSLYVLGGRNTYEFVRLNLPGALPTLSTVDLSLRKSGGRIDEGEFRYDDLQNHQRSYRYQIAVCSEDCTAVIRKVTYNAVTDTFGGFSTPLLRGIPISRHFRTNSFEQLKNWFESKDKSNNLNIHMLQPLTSPDTSVSPFLLAAYGIGNSFTAIDVLNRWKWMFEKSQQAGVRIVAFATDCDPRYLLAMRLALGFFVEINSGSIYDPDYVLEIALPRNWSTWFFMRTRQVFFCMQDPIHLCTKLRNRVLSQTASLAIGRGKVSVEVLMELIQNKSKLTHGLVKTDIEPKDKQNFHSCLKISSDEVLTGLEEIDGSLATQIYLRLLRSVVVAYVEHDTSIIDRIYHSWLTVFLCRIWWTWLETFDEKDFPELRSMKNRSSSFITVPALFSIELNAHSLLSICLLVIQGDLPESALSISKYDSQSCESTFRLTRSMSGTFSSIVNFTTEQFLKRAGKLAVLTENREQMCLW